MKYTETLVIDFLPKPASLPNGSTYGNFSVVTPRGVRYVRYQALRDWQGETDTETEFTRRFLRTLPRRLCRKNQRAGFDLSRPPLYVRPCALEDAAYVDITSAYQTFYSRFGWKVEYLRGRYLGLAEPLLWPYPQSWKIGRSYVVSGARPLQQGRFVRDGKLIFRAYRSPFSNPPLVAAVYDALSALARLAVYSFGAKYWNIDGGIMPAWKAKIFIELLASWRIPAKVKYSGQACIYSSSHWGIGEHTTARIEAGKPPRKIITDHIPLTPKEADWFIEKSWMKGM